MRPVGKQEVPRLGVGVIQRIPEDHLEIDVGGATHERVDVPSRRLDAGTVGERRARDQAHREHASPRQFGIRRRDDDVGFVGEVRGEALKVPQLLRQVDGVVQHLRELADDHRGSQLCEPGILVLEIRRDRLHELEIPEDAVLHAVVEHLHRHRRPVMECRPVNLRDRPRRHRLRFERAVEVRHGRAQLAFNQGLRDTRWIRGDRRLQLRQLRRDVIADDIRSQAQHLPELDPRGAELGQRPPQPLAVGHRDDLRVDVAVDEPLHDPRADEPAPTLNPRRKAVLREHLGDLVESLMVAHQRSRQSRHGSLLHVPAHRAYHRLRLRCRTSLRWRWNLASANQTTQPPCTTERQ